MSRHIQDLNDPSFFRRGGLLLPLDGDRVHLESGKNGDGTWYIQITGRPNVNGVQRSHMTPRQWFDLCTQGLRGMGYEVDLQPPEPDSYDRMVAEANRA